MRKLNHEEKEMANYMELTAYNKTKEIELKILEGRAPETDRERFVNVFRTEVKIKNDKLNSNKEIGKDKTLDTYYNDKETSRLYKSLTEKIFGANDFYRIDIALDIIDKEEIRETTKNKLKELLKRINKYGYTETKKYWVKTYSDVTFRNHIKKIEALGINVLTFDIATDGIKFETEKMKNFTRLENTYNRKEMGE